MHERLQRAHGLAASASRPCPRQAQAPCRLRFFLLPALSHLPLPGHLVSAADRFMQHCRCTLSAAGAVRALCISGMSGSSYVMASFFPSRPGWWLTAREDCIRLLTRRQAAGLLRLGAHRLSPSLSFFIHFSASLPPPSSLLNVCSGLGTRLSCAGLAALLQLMGPSVSLLTGWTLHLSHTPRRPHARSSPACPHARRGRSLASHGGKAGLDTCS